MYVVAFMFLLSLSFILFPLLVLVPAWWSVLIVSRTARPNLGSARWLGTSNLLTSHQGTTELPLATSKMLEVGVSSAKPTKRPEPIPPFAHVRHAEP